MPPFASSKAGTLRMARIFLVLFGRSELLKNRNFSEVIFSASSRRLLTGCSKVKINVSCNSFERKAKNILKITNHVASFLPKHCNWLSLFFLNLRLGVSY